MTKQAAQRALPVLIVDEQEWGVAGAAVTLVGVQTLLTDRDGRVTFTLEEGEWALTAAHADFAPLAEFEAHVTVTDKWPAPSWHSVQGVNPDAWPAFVQPDAPLRLVMHRPRTLRGQVVDEAGAPVGGARVIVTREYLAGKVIQGGEDQNVRVTTAGPDGSFELTPLRPGTVTLVLQAPGYANTFAYNVRVNDSGSVQKVTIERGLRLSGEVVLNGAPVAGVRLSANTPNYAKRCMGAWELETDKAGRFVIEHILGASGDENIPCVIIWVSDGGYTSPIYWVIQTQEGDLPFLRIEAQARQVQKVMDPPATAAGS